MHNLILESRPPQAATFTVYAEKHLRQGINGSSKCSLIVLGALDSGVNNAEAVDSSKRRGQTHRNRFALHTFVAHWLHAAVSLDLVRILHSKNAAPLVAHTQQ